MKTKQSQVLGFLVGFFVMGAVSALAGATFSRVTTWNHGQTLTASALNAEFDNILNNLTPAGVDDYSATSTQMQAATDPYPGSVASLATSLSGEIERLRYQILELKKAIQPSQTYWYQDAPSQGVFTILGSSIGVNNITPSYPLDVAGTVNANNFQASGALDVSGVSTLAITSFTNTATHYSGKRSIYMNSTNVSASQAQVGFLIDQFKIATTDAKGITLSDNVMIGDNVNPSYGGGEQVVFVANAATVPTTDPTGGGILYSQAGAGKWRGSSGTVTTFGPAEPHCHICGSDYMLEWSNPLWGHLKICMRCFIKSLGSVPWATLTEVEP